MIEEGNKRQQTRLSSISTIIMNYIKSLVKKVRRKLDILIKHYEKFCFRENIVVNVLYFEENNDDEIHKRKSKTDKFVKLVEKFFNSSYCFLSEATELAQKIHLISIKQNEDCNLYNLFRNFLLIYNKYLHVSRLVKKILTIIHKY